MSPEGGKPGWLDWADRIGRSAENLMLVVLLSSMLLLGITQIVQRNMLGSGLAWADEALRIMVLWLALIGAVAASRDDRHISIDVMSRILSPRWRAGVAALANAFTAGVCLTLAWYAAAFVAESREFEDLLLGDLPAWWFQTVLPIAFFLIGYRYTVWCVRRIADFLRPGAET